MNSSSAHSSTSAENSTSTTKKRQRTIETNASDTATLVSPEEAKLEALLFGSESIRKEGNSTFSSSILRSTGGYKQGTEKNEEKEEEEEKRGRKSIAQIPTKPAAAWNDDDDDQVNINISNKARLRKLRTNHDEKYITGTEYSTRLKEQFHKLQTTATSVGGFSSHKLTDSSSSSSALIDTTPAWAKGPSERKRIQRSNKVPKTKDIATNDDDDDEEEDNSDENDDEEEENLLDEVLRDTTSLVDHSNIHHQIAAGTLSISRLRDANITDPCRAVVQSSEFHPVLHTSVLFTASLDHRLRFFNIDGKRNTRLASVYFPDLPISSASWTGDGSEVICTGRRSYFYTYDINAGKAIRIPRILGREEKSLESCIVSPSSSSSDATNMLAFLGNNGTVILCSNRTKQWIGNLKMEGNVRSACFTTSYNNEGGVGALEYPELLMVGTSGMVYRWDLRTLKCLHKHTDEGSIGSTRIAAQTNGKQYAVGSTSGIVNIYNTYDSIQSTTNFNTSSLSSSVSSSILSPWSTQTITPVYSVNNLTTSIHTLRYNYDNTILAIGSQAVKDSLKLVHTASGTVFSNWPTDRTPLHYVTSIGFSRSDEYLQVGNDRGRVLLYRLNAYS